MFFSIITYNFLQIGSRLQEVPSIFACFHLFLRITFAALEKPCRENFGKIQEFGKGRFGDSEKDRYFLKILKWQHIPVRDYKREKLVSYFLNNVAKTYLH